MVGVRSHRHIVCTALLVLLFSGGAWGVFSRRSPSGDGQTWIHNQTWDVWVRRPAGWRQRTGATDENLLYQCVDPAGKAVFEVHALRLRSKDAEIEALADALEASMRADAGYFQERLTGRNVTISGGQCLARDYRGNVSGMNARATVRYIRREDSLFLVVCAFPESLASSYRGPARRHVRGFRLTAPPSSRRQEGSLQPTLFCTTVLGSALGEWIHNEDFNFWAYRPASWSNEKEDLPRNGVQQFSDPSGDAGLVIYAAKLPAGQFTVGDIADACESYLDAQTPFLKKRLSSREHPVKGARGVLRRYRGSFEGIGTRATVLYLVHKERFFVVFGFCAEPDALRCNDVLTESVTSFHFASPESYPSARIGPAD